MVTWRVSQIVAIAGFVLGQAAFAIADSAGGRCRPGIDETDNRPIILGQPWGYVSAGRNLVVYLTVRNTARRTDFLQGARSPIAQRGEVHFHGVTLEGAPFRDRGKGLGLPPCFSYYMRPGHFHLMLIGLNRIPKVGERVPITALLRHGSVSTQVLIKATPPDDEHDASGGHKPARREPKRHERALLKVG